MDRKAVLSQQLTQEQFYGRFDVIDERLDVFGDNLSKSSLFGFKNPFKSLTKIALPKMKLPTGKLPKLVAPKLKVPKLKLPKIF